MAKSRGLGRGLDALFQSAETVVMVGKIMTARTMPAARTE